MNDKTIFEFFYKVKDYMLLSEINCARYSSHFYLSTCDLVYKNLLPTSTNLPVVRRVCLELAANDTINVNDSSRIFCDDPESRIEAFLLLFSVTMSKPLIALLYSSINKVDCYDGCFLRLFISEEEDIYIFLLSFFIENPKELVVKDLLANAVEKEYISMEASHSKIFALSTDLSPLSSFALEDFSKKNSFNPKIEKYKLRVRFIYETHDSANSCYSEEFIRNIPLFWMSC